MKQMKRKRTKQKNKAKKQVVRKPLIIYFLIVCVLICLVVFIVSIVCFGIVSAHRPQEKIHIEKIDGIVSKDVAIVPGTTVYEGNISAKAKDRLLAAIELYEKDLVNQIIVSGDVEETKPMTKYLMAKGVSKDDIASDEHGIDTYETLARIKEKYGEQTYYFCTQEIYVNRAVYLMEKLGMDGLVVCVDTMYYSEVGKSMLREYFAATKAVIDPIIYGGNPQKSVKERDFINVPQYEKDPHVIHASELGTPEDYRVVDMNPSDNYDVEKAVKYATTYALEHNPEYPVFEQNCTNFVSQCLVAGGISMQGEDNPSDNKRYVIKKGKQEWYSFHTDQKKEDGFFHYNTTTNFINTNAFIKYFTEERGYELTIYNNDHQGKLACHKDIASGDVLIFFGEDGDVVHVGLITGIGESNAYYCSNTNNRRDYGAFRTSEKEYAQFGLMHMSGKLPN